MRELPLSDALVEDAYRTLVHQFSQSLCFFRELVQNSIDAGSGHIDIWIDYDDATAIIHVKDDGSGMDRTIIDNELTTLFHSSKSNDLTRLGKFGVGFVSVFAVEPEAVVVDTGKYGEAWRLVFNPRGGFERLMLEEPVSGTHVRVLKPMTRDDVPVLRQQSREILRQWCRFCTTPIRFEGEPVNEPMAVDAPVSLSWSESGTDVAAGLVSPGEEAFGYYSGGLTISEGRTATGSHPLSDRPWLRGIAFRINSRHLGHTLTRDTVRVDDLFARAETILQRVVTGPLVEEMYRVLGRRTDIPECIPLLLDTIGTTGKDIRWMPQWASPETLSLSEVRATPANDLLTRLGVDVKDPIVFCTPESSRLSTWLLEHGGVVVLQQSRVVESVLVHYGFHICDPARYLARPEPVPNPTTEQQQLLDTAMKLLSEAGIRFSATSFGRFEPCPALCLRAPDEEGVVAVGSVPRRHQKLMVAADHALLRRLVVLSRVDMPAAAWLLARAVGVATGAEDLDARLLAACLHV